MAALDIHETTSYPYALPGQRLLLSVTFTNTGQVDYEGISIYTPGADVLDDVDSEDQSATSGSFSVSPAAAVWTGNIPVGQIPLLQLDM